MSNLMPTPAFWTLFVFAICTRMVLMYIRVSWNNSPDNSIPLITYSNEVYASISRPLLLLRSIGSSLISTPGPIGLEFLCPGKTCSQYVSQLHGLRPSFQIPTSFRLSPLLPEQSPRQQANLTLVPPHPSLNAASCANSSPNPNIKPLTNGNTRLIAAPRSMLKNVGGL